ncbi:MAG: hypothetical protein HRT58_17485 [Crocinitomicaceae bacterium]|nr:hypothetical protein [Flavobacteriales bacterium]NQZ37464.1 hypothetical protein [Crocinitomicaceae bacterium]
MKIKNGILMIAFILPLGVFGQIQSGLSESSESLSQADKGFEDYCLKESISYIEVVASKSSGIIFSGEMTSMELNSNATHLDYGVELKEEKTQYFELIGSEKVLSVKSLFVLRLNYNNSIKSN